MTTIEFTVDAAGETTLRIKGIKGKACKPIHDAFTEDLGAFGVEQISSTDTPEMNEAPLTVSHARTARVQTGS